MRPLRTGLLSFGLVSIPVQLYTATKDGQDAVGDLIPWDEKVGDDNLLSGIVRTEKAA